MVVTATRAPQAAATLPVTVDIFTADDLRNSPAATIDDTLRQSAAFSLFRRSGSLTANPTAQGVSLRGLGPSGASRSLVLLDGVPLNDPFGGWIAWTKLPKLSLDRAEIVRGGGSTAWGNAALGGTVQLFTSPPSSNQAKVEATVGDRNTLGGETVVTRASASGTTVVRVDAAAFHTDGADLVETPGRIDRPADLDTQRAQATFLAALNPTTTLIVDTRAFAEDRGNGTPLQRNASHEAFLSATLAGSNVAASASEWSAIIYFQTQSFSSFFTSVNAARTAETPASNQYDVPSTAAGGAFTATWAHDPDATTTAGTDVRWVTGETREDYLWSVPLNQFTRRRYAGGEQTFPASSPPTNACSRPTGAARSAPASTPGKTPTATATSSPPRPAPSPATTTTPTKTASPSAPTPASSGRPRPKSARAAPFTKPSASPRSTNTTAPSASAPSRPTPTRT